MSTILIEASLTRQDAVEVFSMDYSTPDGIAISNYLHVADLDVQPRCLFGGEVRATGTGRAHSVNEVICAIEKHSARRVSVPHRTGRPCHPAALVTDPLRALEVLGWQPQYRQLHFVIAIALDRHAKELSLKRATAI